MRVFWISCLCVIVFLLLSICTGRIYYAKQEAGFVKPYQEMVDRKSSMSDFKSKFGEPVDIRDWKELLDFQSNYIPRKYINMNCVEYFLVYEKYPYCAYVYFDADKKAYAVVVGHS